MNKKNKQLIILGIILIAIWGLVILVFKKEEKQQEVLSETQYIILDDNYFWKYKSNNWSKLYTEEQYEEFNWKKFDIYTSEGYYNTYKYVVMNSKTYYFDDDNNEYNVPNNNILLNNNSYFELKKYNLNEFNDNDYKIVSDYLEKNNRDSSNLTVKKKYKLTENNNIYVVSNYNKNLKNQDSYYFVFSRIQNKNYLLINKNYLEDYISYDLAWILDINDKYNNIILKFNCDKDICYDMFQYKNETYTKVIGSSVDS